MSLNTEVSPRTAVFSLLGLLLLSGGVVFGVVRMHNAPAEEPALRPKAARPAVTAPAPATTAADTATTKAGGKDAYAVIVTRNLFGGMVSTPPVTKKYTGPLSPFAGKPLPVVTPFNPTVTTPEVPRPKLAYTGLVEVAGVTYALIESPEYDIAQYTRVGGTAFGCKVTAIGTQLISVEYQGASFDLMLGENKTDVPIAPPKATAPPAQPAPNAQPAANPNGTPPQNGQFPNGFRGRGNFGGQGGATGAPAGGMTR
jgi:hypothetical protein